MAINFFIMDVPNPVFKRNKLKSILKNRIVSSGKQMGHINVIFCGDNFLLDMNRKHLEHDYLTDVITFEFNEDKMVSGDIYISYDRLKENAKIFSVRVEFEIVRVVGHGVCHLLGFKDGTEREKKIMQEQEEKILKLYSRPGK